MNPTNERRQEPQPCDAQEEIRHYLRQLAELMYSFFMSQSEEEGEETTKKFTAS